MPRLSRRRVLLFLFVYVLAPQRIASQELPTSPLQFQCFLGSHALGGSRIPRAVALAFRSLVVLLFPTLKLGVGGRGWPERARAAQEVYITDLV